MNYNNKEYAFVTQKNNWRYFRCINNPKDEIKVCVDVIEPCKIKEELK